ncbi:MAG: hypothetical protein ACKVVP_21475 [Chloroflexota bacterium]
MALIVCPECKKVDVSDQASACPNCGFPLRTAHLELRPRDAPSSAIEKTKPLVLALFILVAVDQVLSLTGLRDVLISVIDDGLLESLDAIDPLVGIPRWWSALSICVSRSNDWLGLLVRVVIPAGSNCLIHASWTSFEYVLSAGPLAGAFFAMSYVLAFVLLHKLVSFVFRVDLNIPLVFGMLAAIPIVAVLVVAAFKVSLLALLLAVKFTLAASVLLGALYKVWDQLGDLRKVTGNAIRIGNPFRARRRAD